MAQLASLLVPGVQISGPTWADGLFEGLEDAGTRINQNRSFGRLADIVEGKGAQPQQQGGFLSSLLPQRQQPQAAPVMPVQRGPIPDDYYSSIRSAESGGNDAARNPRSSATGRYQFTSGTWDGLRQRYPDLGLTPDGRLDPSQQERAIRAFTQENAGTLSSAGIPVNPGNLYAAHFLGAGGARNVLGGDDNALVSSYVGPEVVQANPFLQGMTVGQFREWAASKGGRGNGGYSAPTEAAAAIDMIAPGGNGSPLTDGAFDARFGGETTPVVGREALAARLAETNEQPVSGYVDPMVSVQPQAQQPAAFAPNQVADASGAVGLPAAAGLSPDLGMFSNQQIAELIRDRNTREVGIRLLQQKTTGSNDSPFHFLSGKDGTLFRANKQTGQIDPVGNFGAAGGGDGEEWGLNPVWGRNEKGETVLGQVSKSGKFKPLDTGDFTPTPGISNIDAGTSVITRNNRTGQVIAETPKDIAGAAAQDEIGTAQGKNIASASGDIQAAQNSIDLIESLRNDPNRGWGTGKSSVFNQIPGSPGFDFQQKVNQATSGAFLTAIQQMRGLGALSNAEGQTATAAVTRMNTASSEQEFLNALSDYEKIVRQGLERAQSRLQGQQSQQRQADTAPVRATNPQTGETLELRNGQWVRAQ